MALKGDLQSVDLAQVFQMLALNQKVGILCIQAPRAWKALYFDDRGATLYFNEHVLLDRVLQQMARSGRIDEDAVGEAREHSVQHNVGLVDSLIAGGYVVEEDLQECMQIEMEEEIYDLFFWRDATFEFYEGATVVEGREGTIDESCFFSTDSLIMEAARRIDEWSFIRERVPGPLEIYYPATDHAADMVAVDDSGLAVFDVVDGRRNVARIVEVTGLPSFTVYKSLAVLLDAGALAPTTGEDLMAAAEECVAERRWQDAINAYEQAINCDVGIPDAHLAVADVYEQHQKEFELASYHRKCHAEFCAADGMVKEAIETLQGVIEMVPTDLAARERLVELTVGRTDLASKTFDPVKAGKELVDLYLEIGEIERVRSILERLLRDNPYDLELKKSLVNVHTKAGDTRRVIELYESMAEDLVDAGEPIEAVKYLHKILHLDRERKDVLEQIRSLYELDERRRSRRRSLLVLGATFCVLAAVAVVWFFYEQHAREKYSGTDAKARSYLKQKLFAQAELEYKRFVELFPLTIVSTEARSELDRVLALKKAEEQKQLAKERKEQQLLEKKRKVYRVKYQQVADVLGTDPANADLPDAIEKLEEVREAVKECNRPEDYAWAESVRLDRQIEDLEGAMKAAFDIERQAREALAQGNWQQARQMVLKLIEDYSLTPLASVIRVPIRIESRPAGASILFGGTPLTDADGEPVVTPAVVQVPQRRGGAVSFELRLAGFQPATVEMRPLEQATVEHVLTVVPFTGFRFPGAVNGRVAVPVGKGRVLGAAVQGGQVAFVDRESGSLVKTIKLPGLEEAIQPPLIVGNQIFVATGNGGLSAYAPTRREPLWERRMPESPAWPLLVHDGRLLVCDDTGGVSAYDVASPGGRVWFESMQGEIVGAPLPTAGRGIWVATANGRLSLVDGATGAVVRQREVSETIDSPIFPVDETKGVVFGADGSDLAFYDMVRARLEWRIPVGQPITVNDIHVEGRYVVIGGDRDEVHVVDGVDGRILASRRLPGRRVFAPAVANGQVFAVVREFEGTDKARDLLLALSLDDLEVRWEFRDTKFAAPLATDGRVVWIPGSDGVVRRFQ